MRIILFTGKGGTGKTSIAAATALRTAQQGKKTLVMSTDQAHSLADCLEIPVGAQITRAADGLDALEVDMAKESEKAFGEVRGYLRQILDEKQRGQIDAEEVLLFPGLEELASLLRILEIVEEDAYDVLIVDCAPTGETLSLLRYPEQLRVLSDKVMPLLRSITSAFGGLISRRTEVPKPRDAVFTELDKLVKRLSVLHEILTDRSRTTLRIVMTPEQIVVREAARSYMWLSAFDYGVDAVYMNRIWPEEALRGDFAGYGALQDRYMGQAAEHFSGLQMFRLPLQEREIRGLKMLAAAAEALYGSTDPAQIFPMEEVYTMERDPSDGTWYIQIRLPGDSAAEIAIEKDEGDLLLTVRNESRRFHLPDNAAGRSLTGWEYDGQILRVGFAYGSGR